MSLSPPPEIDLADLTGGHRPSVQDADLCLRNTARLLTDAAVCGPEGRLMLTELAIEEAAKGILIHWRMDIQDQLGSAEDAPERYVQLKPEVKSLLAKYGTVLGDRALQESFSKHRVKLQHLRFLAEVFGEELRGGSFEPWRPARPYTDPTVQRLAELGEIPEIGRRGRAELTELVSSLAELVGPGSPDQSLDRIRLRATYVDWDDSGEGCTYPRVDPTMSLKLSKVAGFLARTLAMSSVIHRDHIQGRRVAR